jgi:hypothetical protein
MIGETAVNRFKILQLIVLPDLKYGSLPEAAFFIVATHLHHRAATNR